MNLEQRIAKLLVAEVAVDAVVNMFVPSYDRIASEFKEDPKELYNVLRGAVSHQVSLLIKRGGS